MKRWGWWLAGAVVVICLVAVGVWGLQRANDFESLARAGKSDAKAALHSLESKQAAAALASFLKAKDEFGEARDLLGPEWVRGLPWLGHQVSVADTLATIGYEGSAAGAEMAQLLTSADSASGNDRVNQVLRLSRPHLDAALVSLTIVTRLAADLGTDGLVPPLAGAVTELQAQLKPLAPLLQRSQSMLDLERYLFSTQHRFLLVSQNSAELRPTGGFMGTYGLVEFGPDGFALTKFTDVYQLPRDTLDLPLPIRGPVGYSHFSFQDSNWWIDFPTSAKVMNQFWQNLKQPKIDGIVAIDVPTIRDLLKIFGPITVPESSVPLTADNVLEQLTYVIEFENGGPGTDKTLKKKQAALSFAAELLRQVTHLSNDQFLPTMNSLAASTNEKHVQLSFNDATAQAALLALGWGGAIDPPSGTTDLLAVSNGVVKASKANIGVTKTLDYTVALKADGAADTRVVLGYKKSSQLLLGVPRQWMGNYVRVHRGVGTTEVVAGSTAFETLDDATGLPTFGHYFRLEPAATANLVLHSAVPQAMRPADGDTWHYELLLIKQADLANTAATVTVTAPAGWKVSGSTASFRVSGTAVPVTAGPGSVSVKTPLKQDLVLDVTLVKA
ncbi:MAG TPA: DUF4012 domain-containing protein [Propionicimonas sp.]